MTTAVFHNEKSILRRVIKAKEVRFKWTPHALKEMSNDGITKDDIKKVLRTGTVCRAEPFSFEERWNCRGKDLDDRKIEVVVVVQEELIKVKVVTAWTLE